MAQEFEPLDAASVALVACVSPWTRIHTAETFNDAVALPGRAAHLLASPAVETEWKGRDRLGSAGAIWKGHGFGWDEPTATTAFAWGAHASLAEPALRVACHRAAPSAASGEGRRVWAEGRSEPFQGSHLNVRTAHRVTSN